jgi:transposase
MPKTFPPWNAVYKLFRRWSRQGRFERMHDRLRLRWRERAERDEFPSTAILDSQSTRTSPQGGEKGFDAGKRVKGRKRNLVVDTLGLVLAVVVAEKQGHPQFCNLNPHGQIREDVANLYVAGSSVFVTAGVSNPTFTIIALSIRLAKHLSVGLAAP